MQTQASVEIDAPIDLVFQLTNDDVSKWSIVVTEDETLEEVPGVVGTRFRSHTNNNGHEMDFEGIVTKYDPPTHSAVEMTGSHFDMDVGYFFEDLGQKTRVTQVSVVTPKGFLMSIVFKLFSAAMNKQSCNAAQKELDSLKSYCEFKRDSANRLDNLRTPGE